MIGDLLSNLWDEVDARIRYSLLGVISNGRLILSPGEGGSNPIGQLSQTNISYDPSEVASEEGDSSLLDNLNHIRAQINAVDASLCLIWMGW